jgi:hypothetical protein
MSVLPLLVLGELLVGRHREGLCLGRGVLLVVALRVLTPSGQLARFMSDVLEVCLKQRENGVEAALNQP